MTGIPPTGRDEIDDAALGATRAAQAALASAVHDAAAAFGVDVGESPADRLAHVHGFFLRNPGYVTPSRLHRTLQQLLPFLPVLSRIGGLFLPTETGFGQPIIDQMLWQVRTRREPDSTWWMRVNRVLVTDPLVAEIAVRGGREEELVADSERAWVRYLRIADEVKRDLGLEPTDAIVDGKPVALCGAWRRVGLRQRIRAGRRIDAARRAYWTAHDESIRRGRDIAMVEHAAERDRDWIEARFEHGWANFVGLYAKLNPPATGRHAGVVQRAFLPIGYEDPARYDFHATRCMFAAMLDVLDPGFDAATGAEQPEPGAGTA